jgi:long-chain acyl-CoA synthetase
MVIFYYLHKHIPITFCDHITRIGERMKDTQPTIMTTVPRLLEKVQNSMSQRTLSKPSPTKEIGRWALTMALTHPIEKDWPLLSWFIADQLVYKKFREALGGKLKALIVGGAPLSPRLARFYNNIGIPTYQGYGLSESSPVIALNFPGHNREGRVGKAFPNVQIKIDPVSQEICAKGPGIMSGYLEDDNVVDDNGWLHTGDLGKLDNEGYLHITGRKKEMFKTSNGKYVCPVPIEDELSTHPWVDQSIVIAEGRSYVVALLTPDINVMPTEHLEWVKSGQQPSEDHPLKLQEHLDALNAKLNPWEKVQKVAWLKTPLSIEENDLTPTMKIKRHVIEKKYLDFIESLYNTIS